MSRLTERNESGGISVKNLSGALVKLAELEDAEQEGRLVLLPSETEAKPPVEGGRRGVTSPKPDAARRDTE